MLRIIGLIALPLLVLLLRPAQGEEGVAAERIAWSKDFASGLARAKEAGRPLMICINAKYVEGRRSLEPAAKGLREVYREIDRLERTRITEERWRRFDEYFAWFLATGLGLATLGWVMRGALFPRLP
jgi:hypothetical protein